MVKEVSFFYRFFAGASELFIRLIRILLSLVNLYNKNLNTDFLSNKYNDSKLETSLLIIYRIYTID
jgi:hypothetical protein